MKGAGFGVRVEDLGFRVSVWDLGSVVEELEFRGYVQVSGFRVIGGSRISVPGF